jgi:hypothetical protein
MRLARVPDGFIVSQLQMKMVVVMYVAVGKSLGKDDPGSSQLTCNASRRMLCTAQWCSSAIFKLATAQLKASSMPMDGSLVMPPP